MAMLNVLKQIIHSYYAIKLSFKGVYEPDAYGDCNLSRRNDEWFLLMHSNCSIVSACLLQDAYKFSSKQNAEDMANMINEANSKLLHGGLRAYVEKIGFWQNLKIMCEKA